MLLEILGSAPCNDHVFYWPTKVYYVLQATVAPQADKATLKNIHEECTYMWSVNVCV